MKAQNLIDEYNQKVEAEERARTQRKADMIRAAQAFFVVNCGIWLKDLLDEFQPGEVKSMEITSFSQPYIKIILPISFMGLSGEISGHFNYTYGAEASGLWSSFQMGFFDLPGRGWPSEIPLRTDTKHHAAEIDKGDLGALLANVAKAAPIRAEREREKLKNQRADALVFYSDQIPAIAKKIQERVEKFPDLADQIREAGRIAMEEYAQLEFERQEENTRYAIIRAERERLERLGNLAWDLPFTVYEIKFGAFIGDGEGGTEVYAESIYTLNEEPGPDGYYRAFSQGKLTRMIRPTHVLSVERIEIQDQKSAPHDIKRYVDLKSRTVPDAEVSVYLPAVELFVFDLDEMEVFLA